MELLPNVHLNFNAASCCIIYRFVPINIIARTSRTEPERPERERNGNLDKQEWLDGDRNQTSKTLPSPPACTGHVPVTEASDTLLIVLSKLSALSLAPSNTSAVPVISLACGDQKDTSTRGGEVVQVMKFENTELLGENPKPSVLAVPEGPAKVPEEARADDEIPDNVGPAVKKRKCEKMEFFVEKLEPTIPDVPDVHADALEEARADDEIPDNAALPVKRRKTCEKMEDKVKKCMEFDKEKLRLPIPSVEDVLDTVFKKSRADDDRFNHLLDQCRKVQDKIAELLFFYF